MGKRGGGFNWIWFLIMALLIGLTAISVVRNLAIGLDRDEEYAVVLACRLASGDLLLKEMWEPHQTSAILPALLIRLFQMCRGNNTGLLYYLRTAGMLMQASICVLWYKTLHRIYGRKPAMLTAFMIFLTVPKWMTTPEFANQQIWFMVLLVLFLVKYQDNPQKRYCIAAGLAMVWMVLAYPSCILLFIPYFVWLFRKKWQDAMLFLATCGGCAAVFLGHLLSYLSPAEIWTYVGYMAGDPEHSAGIGEKLLSYGAEALEIFQYIAVYAGVAIVLAIVVAWLGVKVYHYSLPFLRMFCFWVLLIAMADQARLWILGLMPAVHLQIHYLLLFLLGGALYYTASAEKKEKWKPLFFLAWVPSILVFAAVLLLTNLDMKASFAHLLPGMLCGVLFWCDGTEEGSKGTIREKEWFRLVLPMLWVIILAGARIFLLRGEGGFPENVFCVKQKALYGSAENIYCAYMIGYQYNSDYLFLNETLALDEKVFYIGDNMLTYLMTDMDICGASTISTPVYDDRYLEYFEVNPEKVPSTIVIDKSYWKDRKTELEDVREWLYKNYNWRGKQESEFLWIVRK